MSKQLGSRDSRRLPLVAGSRAALDGYLRSDESLSVTGPSRLSAATGISFISALPPAHPRRDRRSGSPIAHASPCRAALVTRELVDGSGGPARAVEFGRVDLIGCQPLV
jgi:hypothetical protein